MKSEPTNQSASKPVHQSSNPHNLKVLAFSDTHGRDIRDLASLAEKEHVDLVIACGDWTFNDEVPPYFASQFLSKGKRMLVLPGNHESEHTANFLSSMYKVRNLHGEAAIYDGVGFFGAGGANIGPNLILDDDETFELLKHGFEKVKHAKKKIMVTHVHPSGSIMELGRFPGSEGVRKAIEQFRPDLVICGHVHEAAGFEEIVAGVKVVNVAQGKVVNV